jgi:hypothetical protein
MWLSWYIQDHFAASTIADLNLLALIFKEYSNVLESKTYQPAYTTHNPMLLFVNGFTNQLEMLFESSEVKTYHSTSPMWRN